MTFRLWRCLGKNKLMYRGVKWRDKIASIWHQISSDWLAPPKCGFKPDDYESHDIAILELEKEVKLSDGISSAAVGPICLPDPGEVKPHLSKFYNLEFPIDSLNIVLATVFALFDLKMSRIWILTRFLPLWSQICGKNQFLQFYISPHDRCEQIKNLHCFVVVKSVLWRITLFLRNPFWRDLRAFAWRKIEPKIG